jgi:hypothetical protein
MLAYDVCHEAEDGTFDSKLDREQWAKCQARLDSIISKWNSREHKHNRTTFKEKRIWRGDIFYFGNYETTADGTERVSRTMLGYDQPLLCHLERRQAVQIAVPPNIEAVKTKAVLYPFRYKETNFQIFFISQTDDVYQIRVLADTPNRYAQTTRLVKRIISSLRVKP